MGLGCKNQGNEVFSLQFPTARNQFTYACFFLRKFYNHFLLIYLMRLIITRHGETVENRERIIIGHLQGKLSDLGKEQSKKLAKRLKDEKIDFIYSSDLARAVDTAKIISKLHSKSPVKFIEELREANWGEFEGKKRDEVGNPIESKQGESIKQLYNRAKKVLDILFNKHKNDTVLIVTHGRFIRALICVITNKQPEEIITMDKIMNASINIFEIDEDRNHKMLLLNDTKHLD